jgi:hypothetical protein
MKQPRKEPFEQLSSLLFVTCTLLNLSGKLILKTYRCQVCQKLALYKCVAVVQYGNLGVLLLPGGCLWKGLVQQDNQLGLAHKTELKSNITGSIKRSPHSMKGRNIHN